MEQREGELVYLKLDMDGADGKALSSQGILAGTEYEYYKPFDDAPEYEEYKEVPKWLKVVAGVAVAAVVGLAAAALGVTAVQLGMTAGVLTAGAGIAAVAATAASDKKNGTESSLGDYISNAFWASARVGGSCIAITLGMYGAEVMTMTVSGGMGLIPVGGTVVTLPQLAGAFLLVAGTVTSQNLLFQMREVLMFCISGKEMGAPTGNWLYDSVRELTEMASTQFAFYGLMNPYTYQRPKITPLPNETGLTVPGGTGVAVVPNGTAPALKQPYLPGQYTEYPAAVQGLAQQALPGGESSIETSSKTIDDIIDGLPETTNGKGVARNFESTSDFEQTIRDFDALNPSPEWLESGKGNMFNAEPDLTAYRLRTDNSLPLQSVPLYSIEGTAGLVPLFTDQAQSKPVNFIHIPNLPKCDGAIYIVGDSMYPLLKRSCYENTDMWDSVICEYYIRTSSHNNKVFLLCHLADQVTLIKENISRC